MVSVVALYRYPVKGLTPEPCDELTVLDSGAVAGDRVLALLPADDDGEPDRGTWWNPKRFIALKTTPELTRLEVRFDADAATLRATLDGELLVEAGLDHEGRERIGAALTEFVRGLDRSPLRGHPEREPLRLVGDPARPAYADHVSRHISVIGRSSLEALAQAMGSEIDERRFRGNVMVEGTAPWEEFGWAGRRLRIGAMEFEVQQPIVRCVVTHANPDSGERDLDVMNTLTQVFGHEQPLMGVLAVPAAGGGPLELGDEVAVID